MAEAEKKKTDPRTVKLKRVRLSFTDALFEKKKTSDESDKLSHHCNLIIEKGQPEFEANNAAIMAAIREAGKKQWGDEDAFKEIQEEAPKRVCYRAGNRWKNKDGQVYAGYDGNFGLTGKGPGGGQKRPKLLDRRKRRLREQATGEHIAAGKVFEEKDILDVCYGGSYADAIVSFYGTDKGSRGIFCTIEAIRSHEEGERMSGGYVLDDDDFEDLDDDDSFDDDMIG